ncbi:MAG TPA: sensor histidine kinase [Pseudomonadota bacterium]|nr:sensor histidine kinase [Pseudomonadota bacterium]HQY36160.1 sensor histidine kinase [Pseudomonadota bacterium]HRA36594.1 sensor histidine kinase [Pseudomonadota bacterium]
MATPDTTLPWLDLLKARGNALQHRLLPPVLEPGAMPWFSLIYLCFLLFPVLLPRNLEVDWWLTAIAALAFLPMYFGFYWTRGWRRVGLLLAMGLLSVVLLPANVFANTFLVYANVLAAFLPWGPMLAVIAATQAMYALGGMMLDAPMVLFVTTVLFMGLMSALCNRVWIAKARANQALRLSQDEIRRLAQVAERERIGRDLHDLLGHTLSVIAIKAELASKLALRDPSASQREIADVERVAREALGQVRRAVAGMRAMGLRAEFASARLALAAVEVDFDYRSDELALHPETETVLALALREAATNVIRHAQARRCSAELARSGDIVRLAIRDDGLGGARADGNGLMGMRERVEAIGGELRLQSANGEGTLLELRVPWRAPPAPGAASGDAPAPRRLVAVR